MQGSRSGCAEQERVIVSLCNAFPEATVVDRRANPNYGYRAIHVIARISGKLVEIQVRTVLQHVWAELSEKLSDVHDPDIKYGGGPEMDRELLTRASHLVAKHEELEQTLHVEELPEDLSRMKKWLTEFLRKVVSDLESQKGQKQ